MVSDEQGMTFVSMDIVFLQCVGYTLHNFDLKLIVSIQVCSLQLLVCMIQVSRFHRIDDNSDIGNL